MKKATLITLLAACTISAEAQRIDFNITGKESQSLEDGYTNWSCGRQASAESTFADNLGNTVTVKAESVPGLPGNAVLCNWWKDGVNRYSKLVSDAIYPIILDENNNYSWSATEPMGIQFTVTGLTAGEHTLTAYHNNTDGKLMPGYPTIKVLVDGKTVATGIRQTIRAEKHSDAGMSYIRFTAEEGKAVTIQYISEPTGGASYINTSVAVNALVFDSTNPRHRL